MKLVHKHRTEFIPVIMAPDLGAPALSVHLTVGESPAIVRMRFVPPHDAPAWARWLTWLHDGVARGVAYADVRIVSIEPAQP